MYLLFLCNFILSNKAHLMEFFAFHNYGFANMLISHVGANATIVQHTKRRSQKHNATPPPSDVNNQHVSNKPPASIEPEVFLSVKVYRVLYTNWYV